jgi:hypothetical protein
MPQQLLSISLTSRFGIKPSTSCTGLTASKAFWWQWPCNRAVACGSAFSFSFSVPAFDSRAMNSSNSMAAPASNLASSPKAVGQELVAHGQQAGGLQAHHRHAAPHEGQQCASMVRRASCFASSTCPAAR